MPDVRPVVHIIGLLGCCIAAMLCLPALVDLLYANADWVHFASAAGIAGFLGIVSALAARPGERFVLDLRQAFLVTGFGWIVAAILAALPYVAIGIDFTDAVFEAMSGITTTGSTVLVNLDALPPGILLWRALTQWIGGIGILAIAILMLPLLRVGGMQLFRIEGSGRPEERAASAKQTLVSIFVIYLALTAICTLLYLLFGMSAFDAVTHAMATLSTGGYSTHDASFGYFDNLQLHWIAIVFMLLGALPFFLYIKSLRGNLSTLLTDAQVRGFISFVTIASVLLAWWLMYRRDLDFLDALTLTTFNITSVITTTGFASDDYTAWGSGAVGFFLVLMFIGGCSGSTSGAIKFYRIQVAYLVLRAHIKRLISPHRAIVIRYNGRRLPNDIPASIMAFLTVFIATIAIFTVCLAFLGLDLITAYSASVTAITNVGPGLGGIIGPAGNFAPLPDAAKWILCFAMLAGRLEVLALLIAFDPDFWRD